MIQINNPYLIINIKNKLKRKDTVLQRGQAISETLLILGVFFILMLGIQATTSLQLTAIKLLLDSVKKVFQTNLGNTFGPVYAHLPNPRIKSANKLIAFENNHLLISPENPLFKELNMTQPGFIQARSERRFQRLNEVKIYRQSFTEAGTGYASSNRDVQTRIGMSVSLWRDTFNRTTHAMDGVHSLASKVDSAWKRPAIHRDFLQPWAGVVPEKLLLQGDTWRN